MFIITRSHCAHRQPREFPRSLILPQDQVTVGRNAWAVVRGRFGGGGGGGDTTATHHTRQGEAAGGARFGPRRARKLRRSEPGVWKVRDRCWPRIPMRPAPRLLLKRSQLLLVFKFSQTLSVPVDMSGTRAGYSLYSLCVSSPVAC